MGKAKGHLLLQACPSGPPYATFMMLLPLFWRSNGATSLFGLFLKGLELQEHWSKEQPHEDHLISDFWTLPRRNMRSSLVRIGRMGSTLLLSALGRSRPWRETLGIMRQREAEGIPLQEESFRKMCLGDVWTLMKSNGEGPCRVGIFQDGDLSEALGLNGGLFTVVHGAMQANAEMLWHCLCTLVA